MSINEDPLTKSPWSMDVVEHQWFVRYPEFLRERTEGKMWFVFPSTTSGMQVIGMRREWYLQRQEPLVELFGSRVPKEAIRIYPNWYPDQEQRPSWRKVQKEGWLFVSIPGWWDEVRMFLAEVNAPGNPDERLDARLGRIDLDPDPNPPQTTQRTVR